MPLRLIIGLICLMIGLPVMKADVRSDSIKVSLLTAHAGADIYQLEGHTALRIRMEGGGDYVVNWGLFDFDAPNFVYRFVKGETDYMAGAAPTPLFLTVYAREGRAVVEQTLNLTGEEKMRVLELITRNLQPENRVYRYNYVLDNCATRPLAIIERAIGDTLSFGDPGLPDEAVTTFRNAMRHYHTNYPWYQFGIDLALGSGIDRPISRHEMAFAPEALESMLATAVRPDGRAIVGSSDFIVGNAGSSAVLDKTPFLLTPMFWSLVVLAISVIVSWCQLRNGKPGTAAKIFDTVYFLIMGLTGCVIVFLIFISVHEATSPNWLLLWLNPLCFIPVVATWVKRYEKLLFSYQILNFAFLIALLTVFTFGVQSANPAFIPLIAADVVRALSCIFTNRSVRCQHAKIIR
ncbi:MAG: DUF4105 domain-containing protein [Bacteroides sp.]|nr:DUF4105 domain-containing protein [Bacteroides sp.]